MAARPDTLRRRRRDLLALFGVATLFVAVFSAVPNAVGRFSLDYSDPVLLTFWTSVYVHHSSVTLLGNLLAYALAVVPAWAVYLDWHRRRDFWLGLSACLLVAPVVTSTGNYLAYLLIPGIEETVVSYGFSEVVGALTGFLFGSLLLYVADRYGAGRMVDAGAALVAVPLVVQVLAVTRDVALAVGLGGGAAAAILSNVLPAGALGGDEAFRETLAVHRIPVAALAAGILAASVLTFVLFPVDVLRADRWLFVGGHVWGILFGAAVALWLAGH